MATTATDATAQYKDLAAALRGGARTPGEPGYAARAVYNAMIDKRPAAIVRCNVFHVNQNIEPNPRPLRAMTAMCDPNTRR